MFQHITYRTIFFVTLLVIICTAGLGAFLIDAFNHAASSSALIRELVAGVAISAVLAVLLAVLLASRVTRPIAALARSAARISEGQFDQPISVSSRDEIAKLSNIFRHVAERLNVTLSQATAERDRLAVILAQMGEAIFILDENKKVVMTNPAAEKLFHKTQAEILDHTFIEVVLDFELDNVVQQAINSAKQQSSFIESRHFRQFLGLIATPLPATRELAVLVQDLTELRRLETVRRDFVANISHELRTPISSLKAIAETLSEGALEDPTVARDFLKRMQIEADKLAQMVQELMELARIESGQAPLHRTASNLAEIAAAAVSRLKPLADREGLSLELSLDPALPPVQVDRDRLEQVIVNLLHNAIKFTPPPGRIKITARQENKRLIVSVSDTGIGISEVDLPRIFERFYKVDRARSGRGTGLGLAISKHIVQAHGGQIWVESREGKGSTFSFSLPLS